MEAEDIYKKALSFLKNKKASEIDIPEVRYIKGLIRKGEARATSHFVGLPDAQIHFMELPFYETGTIEKKPLGKDGIQITMDLIEKINQLGLAHYAAMEAFVRWNFNVLNFL